MDWRERFNDFTEAVRVAVNSNQASIWTMVPGILKKVDLTKLTCEVQPAIQSIISMPGQERSPITLPLCVDCPIVFPHGGTYAHTFPVKADDECLLMFSARCIDNWWQSGGVQPPFRLRMHDLSDGFAFVGPYSQSTKISNVSDSTTQWRTADGKIFAEIDQPNQIIRLVTPTLTATLNEANKTIALTSPNTNVTLDDNAKTITATTGSVTIQADGSGTKITLSAGGTAIIIDGSAGSITAIGTSGIHLN